MPAEVPGKPLVIDKGRGQATGLLERAIQRKLQEPVCSPLPIPTWWEQVAMFETWLHKNVSRVSLKEALIYSPRRV
ncbi:hypothetical protein [Thiorhodovibrio frisius]|uniref:hypothetical protein n=1 Tax=Thiorhodovibrio frisius TaxID=631362 RepID=UPI00022C7656|nr:hypothetical protein [Thiorhodovibrio frisius]WPL23871.1 hypothetical protein Thiofri_04078 [Thiorhodovibrio frisius]